MSTNRENTKTEKKKIEKTRTTKETTITMKLAFGDIDTVSNGEVHINTPVPFFSHMLHAMLFHSGTTGIIDADGDVEVDAHHLVEDVGIVLGEICAEYALYNQPYHRFGHSVIPMDDALAECTIDFSNRAFLSYKANFPQSKVGDFDVSLGREFFTAFAHNARINIHLEARYGLNSHHILEALFKSCGKALQQALQSINTPHIQSTKGIL